MEPIEMIGTVGALYASVCADNSVSKSEIETFVNQKYPTGIESDWKMSGNKTFHGGKSNPCPCDDHPNRTHYLLDC